MHINTTIRIKRGLLEAILEAGPGEKWKSVAINPFQKAVQYTTDTGEITPRCYWHFDASEKQYILSTTP